MGLHIGVSSGIGGMPGSILQHVAAATLRYYLSRQFPNFKAISTENKINFIVGRSDLLVPIVYGLYVIFNSSLYDTYYRILNGSTQVNSTEIDSIPVPSLSTIEAMGNSLLQSGNMSVSARNHILDHYV